MNLRLTLIQRRPRLTRSQRRRCRVDAAVLCILIVFVALSYAAEPEQKKAEPAKQEPRTHSLRGRVVWLSEVLARRQIKEVPEAAERVLVLETAGGELHPLVEDIRGRGFRRDERLRNIDVELLVRQHPGVPFIQVIRVFQLRDGAKYELDYWCEICSIAMFELKECECCQGPIELRSRKVDE
jgi:hypothetical protein